MVKAYGPGLHNGNLGDTGEFTIETKDAGIGTLTIRVHGIKDAFKIDAKQESSENPRTLKAHYYPSLPGHYVIFIRWSGDHIPGSPFQVDIFGEGYDGTAAASPLPMGDVSKGKKKKTSTTIETSMETSAPPPDLSKMTKKERKAYEKEEKKRAKEEAKKAKKMKKRSSKTIVEEAIENDDDDEDIDEAALEHQV